MKYPNILKRLNTIFIEVENIQFLYENGDLREETTKDELITLNIRLDFFQEKIKELENLEK